MRALVLCLGLAGCDGVFKLTEVRDIENDAATIGADASSCSTDAFTGGNTDLVMRWNRSIDDPADCSVDAIGGEVVVALGANVSCYAEIEEITPHSFAGSRVTLRVPGRLAGDQAQTYLSISSAAASQSYYSFDYGDGTLDMLTVVNNTKAAGGLSIAYDAVAHLWWRIEHVTAMDSFEFSTSPDGGENFVVRHSLPSTLGTENLRVVIGAGTYEATNPTPGSARFDDFELCRP